MKSIADIVRDNPFFSGLSEEYLELISGCGANESFPAGSFIFREGGSADKFYVIRHGGVALELYQPGREPIILQTRRDGDIMGWSWFIPPYRWEWDARALQLTRVVSFDAVCLRGKLESDSAFGYEMMKRFIPVIHDRMKAARLQMIDMYGAGTK
jgi:CRP/FNR family cyclic AMP-dependent transcriptional regulator